ncbi:hypothetical protein D3C84_633940 [compost metagenome]
MDIVNDCRNHSGINQLVQISRQRMRFRQGVRQRASHPAKIIRRVKVNVTINSFVRRQHDYCFLLLCENNNRRQRFVAPVNPTCSIKISPCAI